MHVSHHQGRKTVSKMDAKTIFSSGDWNSLIWQPPEHPYFTTDLRHWHYHRQKTQHTYLTNCTACWQPHILADSFFIITNYACELSITKFNKVAVFLLIYFHQNENRHYENPLKLIKNAFVITKLRCIC